MKVQNLGIKQLFWLLIIVTTSCCLFLILWSHILQEQHKNKKVKIYCLSGTNYEIGFQRAKLELNEIIKWKGDSKKMFEGPDGAALNLAFRFHLTEIYEKFPSLINEWKGMAHGAQISFEDIAVNMIGERTIRRIAGMPVSENNVPDDHYEACSVFAMAKSDRGPIVGNTGDSSRPPRSGYYIIEKENDAGQYRVVRCKGAGVNEMGLAIGSANSHYLGNDYLPDGPASDLSKVVLRYCPDVDSAVNFIREYKISDDGNHYAMADISGKAAAVEKGPEGLLNVRWANSTGYAFVTNTSPDPTIRSFDTNSETYRANSDDRYYNLQSLFSDSNFTFTFASAEGIIFNHNPVGAICQHGDIYPGQGYTTRTRMMLPQEGKILLAARTSPEQETWKPCETGWVEDTLANAVTGVEHHIASMPKNCKLEQNYPNPFNSQTTIEYELVENVEQEIIIFNLLGEKVKTLTCEFKSAGNYSKLWDGTDEAGKPLASGIYYYQLKAKDIILTKRMTLAK